MSCCQYCVVNPELLSCCQYRVVNTGILHALSMLDDTVDLTVRQPPANNSTTPRPGQRGPDRWTVSYAEIRKALGLKVHDERLILACKGLKRTRTRKLRLSTLTQEERKMSDFQWRGYMSSQGQQGW